MITFDPQVVVKLLKKVVLNVDGFSLAEDEVNPGLEFARYEAALVLYPHRAKELDAFHDEILQTTTLYGWAAAFVYEIQKPVPEGMEDRIIAQVRRVFALIGYNLKPEVLFGTAIREICKLLLEAARSKVMTAQQVSVVAGRGGPGGRCDNLEWSANTLLKWAGFKYICEQVWRSVSHVGVVSDSSLAGAGFCIRENFWPVWWCPHCVGVIAEGPAAQTWELATVALGLATVGGALSGQCIQWHADNANNFQLWMVHVGRMNVEGATACCGVMSRVPGAIPGQAPAGSSAAGIARRGGWGLCGLSPVLLSPPGAVTTLFSHGGQDILSLATLYHATNRMLGGGAASRGIGGGVGSKGTCNMGRYFSICRRWGLITPLQAEIGRIFVTTTPNQQAVFTLDHLALLRADLVVSSRDDAVTCSGVDHGKGTAQLPPDEEFEGHGVHAVSAISDGLPGLDGTGVLLVLLGLMPPDTWDYPLWTLASGAVADTAVGSQRFDDLGQVDLGGVLPLTPHSPRVYDVAVPPERRRASSVDTRRLIGLLRSPGTGLPRCMLARLPHPPIEGGVGATRVRVGEARSESCAALAPRGSGISLCEVLSIGPLC
ncbi:hypothetical protein BC829DRAFT_446898 [Chytridium lagenaria]|nr:hypothetical protein BC829DRAFT_446898 [Chytridium lagenaria]